MECFRRKAAKVKPPTDSLTLAKNCDSSWTCISGRAHEVQRWITCFPVFILWLITEWRQWRRCSVEMNICRRRGNCRRCSFPLRLQPQIYSGCQEYCPYGRWRDVSDIRRSGTVNVVSIYSSITWREQQPSQGLTAWRDKGKMLTASMVSVIFLNHVTEAATDKTIFYLLICRLNSLLFVEIVRELSFFEVVAYFKTVKKLQLFTFAEIKTTIFFSHTLLHWAV